MSTTTSMWVWRSDLVETGSVEGFSVEALDGSIGKIDETTSEVGGSYVVVDTGPWIFGKKVLLPAGMIQRVDPTDERVFVALTKEQIKNAPEFDDVDLPRRRIPLVAGRLLRAPPEAIAVRESGAPSPCGGRSARRRSTQQSAWVWGKPSR